MTLIGRAALLTAALMAGVAVDAFATQISGRVTSSTTSAGLSGTVIQIFDLNADEDPTTVTTDGDGYYTIDLPPGSYALFTQNTQGYINEIYNNLPCSAVCDLNSLIPIELTTVPLTNIDFVLDPGGLITGRITASATGLPIAGVIVRFIPPNGAVFFTSAITNANGDYTSDGGTAAGNVFALTENSLGYRNETYNNIYCTGCDPTAVGTPIPVTLGTTSGIDFALDVGGRITGRVTDTSANPIANLGINIYDSAGNSLDFTNTDASGNYSTGGLPAASYFVSTDDRAGFVTKLYNNISCIGFCNVTTGTLIPVTVGATASGIDFVLPAAATITGTVTNAAGGALLNNIFVSINSSGGAFLGGSNTNNAGVYRVDVPAGTYYAAIFNAAGFTNQVYNNVQCAGFCNVATVGTSIPVTAGNTTGNINFALASGGSITGTVTDASTTTGVNGVSVQLYSSTGSFQSATNADGSGNYTLSGIPTGSYYVRTSANSNLINQLYNGITCINCSVTTSGGALVPVTSGATTPNINFALAHGGRISGTISNASTLAAIEGVNAQIVNSAGINLASFLTNASGVFTTAGLPVGTYYVRTSNTLGFINKLYNDLPCPQSCVATSGAPVTVALNTTTPNINFALTTGGRFSGTITNASTLAAIPFSSAQIYNATGTFLGNAQADGSGFFITSGLPAGTYYSRTANSQGFVEGLYNGISCPLASCNVTTGAPITVNVGATTPGVNFALSAGGRISGTVTNFATGTPLAGVSVVIYSGGASPTPLGSLSTDGSGNYTTGSLLPGNYFTNAGGFSLGYTTRLYNNRPFCTGSCMAATGTPVGVAAGVTTPGINLTLTPLFVFTDAFLAQQSTIAKTVHITELRADINLLRQQLGLSAFTFTDASLSAGTTPIKLVHISELRTALNEAYDALAMARPSFTDPVLTAGSTPIKAVHIQELRDAVRSIQ